MAELSVHDCDIIAQHPLNDSLYRLQDLLHEAEQNYNDTTDHQDEICQQAISKLLITLMGEKAAFKLGSRTGDENLASDLASLFKRLQQGHLIYNHCRALAQLVIQKDLDVHIWNAVFCLIDAVSRGTPPPPPHPTSSIQQTPWLRNTSSFANSTEYRKHVDIVLKEELGEIHVDIPRFFDAYFGDIPQLTAVSQAVLEECEKGNSPLYREDEGWKGWPELAAEKDVLRWLANIITELVRLTEAQEPSWKVDRRPLAQPSQPLQGSVAERKLDVGLVDDLTATVDSKCHWSQILVPGELKNDPKYDRKSGAWFDLGRYTREVLTAQDTRHFVLRFTLCGQFLQLWNFDRLGGITSEEFNINQDGLQFVSVILEFLLMSRKQLGFDPTIVATGTERYIEIDRNDKLRTPLVVKDSWQYPERTEEGELLREAMMKGVKNVARYYHHETVRIDNKDDDVLTIRKGLGIPISKDEKGGFNARVRRSRSQRGKKSQGSTAGQKRSSDCMDKAFPPPRYMSLHDEAGLIQCDISPRNLMMNEDKNNPSWPAFLINLDLAIKLERDGSSGARGKTGTRAFMAIGVLYGEKHCFMHDLESFFWVLFWICIHYESPGKGITVKRFEKWNYMSTEELAAAKQGVISEEGDFLRIAQYYFTPYYQSLIPCVNRLRRLVFPDGGRWKKPNFNLSQNMIGTLQHAQDNSDAVN
ncbi:hypothetical protein BDDG_09097 [Blastomyces dermatitidis ATCC 18188]|uniref:Fungal-type protein kinase domain-containing protein n=1 Tax=Ajellomyces dermatitidis (strain ATCC 18188 / CBS 674.68) TaxID=653446 RepID=F2TSD9_AJEDA|nr:hypothetical protein BDDG_09097 [Blastomyces dermatitidis ATCC 18188]